MMASGKCIETTSNNGVVFGIYVEFRGCNPIYASKLVNLPSSYKKRQWYWVITVIFKLSCSCNNCQKGKVCFLKKLQKVSEKSEHPFFCENRWKNQAKHFNSVFRETIIFETHPKPPVFHGAFSSRDFHSRLKMANFQPFGWCFLVKGPGLWGLEKCQIPTKNYASAVTNTNSCLFLRPLTFFHKLKFNYTFSSLGGGFKSFLFSSRFLKTRRRISRKHWRQLNEDSWIKEMFDVSVDMSSVRRTFIPDIFLHQCCQHSFHNFSAMRPKPTPHHQHTNPTPATHTDTHTHTHTTHSTRNNHTHTQTTNTTNTRTRQTQQRQQTHTHTVNDHLAKVESSKSVNIQASNTWHQLNVMPSTTTLELMFECIQHTLHPWKFQTSKFSSHTQGLMAGHARPGIFCRAIGSCPAGAVSARAIWTCVTTSGDRIDEINWEKNALISLKAIAAACLFFLPAKQVCRARHGHLTCRQNLKHDATFNTTLEVLYKGFVASIQRKACGLDQNRHRQIGLCPSKHLHRRLLPHRTPKTHAYRCFSKTCNQ